MCHESTSVGLPQSIGIGKGTVSLDDFDQTELVISIGHNPGTNHPRMMGTLHELSRRGVPIIVFNPLRERGAGAFCRSAERDGDGDPALDADRLDLLPVRAGGDAAALKGIAKALLQLEEEQGNVLDHGFITQHTQGTLRLRRGSACHPLAGYRTGVRPDARIPDPGRRGLRQIQGHHRHLRHGYYPA